ncbi:uncharacterized protein LOC135349623 [Halichondria panicea]|uniref:uncharacterized protein LOC135349623 n=1 Tax=Halichondria panicea TaxID=6063 RepID=UPI00312B2BFC
MDKLAKSMIFLQHKFFNLLLGELSGVSGCGDRMSSLLPLYAETLQHRHYHQHINTLRHCSNWYYVTDMRLYSQDVEGGHTDQRSAAGRAAHQQSGEQGLSETIIIRGTNALCVCQWDHEELLWTTNLEGAGRPSRGAPEASTESVRLYSQKTWRVVTQTRGLQLVLEQHIHKVVSGVMGFSHAVKSLAIKV